MSQNKPRWTKIQGYDQRDRDDLARIVFKGEHFRELGPRKGRSARLYLAMSRGW